MPSPRALVSSALAFARSPYVSSVRALMTLADAGRALGLDVEAAWVRAGLDPSLLKEPAAFIDGGRARAFSADLASEARHVPLGLLAAEGFASMDLGPLAMVLDTCGTLRDAIVLGERFSPLLDGSVRIGLVEDGRAARVALVPRFEPVVLPIMAEHTIGFLGLIARRLTDRDLVPFEVCFAHARVHPLGTYERFFHGPVRFDAPRNELVFARSFLDLPLPRVSRQPTAELLAHIGTLMPTDPVTGDAFGQRVRATVGEMITQSAPSFDDLAERVGVARRTLQRRLFEEGTSAQQIVEDTRRSLGIAYVTDPTLPIDAVARCLGFADRSAFARAFRRWTQASPTEYRRRAEPRAP